MPRQTSFLFIGVIFFFGAILSNNLVLASQYTTDIDSAYVSCITGCLVKEQSCNDLAECVALRDKYVACSFANRDYCLISTPTACNSICLTPDATTEFKAFLYCRLGCFSKIISGIYGIIAMGIVLVLIA